MITLPAAAAALDGLARRCPRQHPLRSFLRLRVRGGPRPTQTYSRPTGAGREGPATAPCAGLTERAGAPRPPAGRNGSRRSHLQTLADSETSTNPSRYYYYHHHYHYFMFYPSPSGLETRRAVCRPVRATGSSAAAAFPAAGRAGRGAAARPPARIPARGREMAMLRGPRGPFRWGTSSIMDSDR